MMNGLSVSKELDRHAMSAVRGGQGLPGWAPLFSMPKFDFKKFSIEASQMVGQSQNVENNNGNNVAFASGITSTVSPVQTANNNINFGY